MSAEESNPIGKVLDPGSADDLTLRVDRSHAVRLAGDAGRRMRDGLGGAARAGFRLARTASPGDVYRLDLRDDLARGIREGVLRLAEPTRGDASVQIRNVTSGRYAGNADLRKVRSQTMDVLGPAAWDALAMAVQQHYLVEMSARLDHIQGGVEELKHLHADDRIGTLNHISELTQRVQAAAPHNGELVAHQLNQLRDKTLDAEEIWNQALVTARRHVEKYQAGEAESEEVTKSVAMLAYAIRVLSECSSALMTLPYRSADELKSVLAEEHDRLYPALPEFLALCDDLLHATEHWATKQSEYDELRSSNPISHTLRLPPMELRVSDGFKFEVHAKPRGKPLSTSETEQLRHLVAATTETPVLVVEIDEDQTVLVGRALV